MPHLQVFVSEDRLERREAALVRALTEAVTAVYGEWVRDQVDVRLLGVRRGRWGLGGSTSEAPMVNVSYDVHASVFTRPDAETVVGTLVTAVTDAVVEVLGEDVRPNVTIQLNAIPPGRTAVAGVITA